MRRGPWCAALVAICLLVVWTTPSSAAVATTGTWTTHAHDAQRSSVDSDQTPFTSIGLHWQQPVDGAVFAQPLAWSGQVFVATESNSVYSFDAVTGALRWQRSIGTPVSNNEMSPAGGPCSNLGSKRGITSTPVIDTATGRLYVVAQLAAPSVHFELVGMDASTGVIVFGAGQAIDPWFLGGAGDHTAAQSVIEQQRGALLLANGYVYVPFGGRVRGCGHWSGWLAGLPIAGQAGGERIFQTPALPYGGSIWSPAGPSTDASGNVWAATGNASCSSCQSATRDLSESVIKFSPTLGILDTFIPNDWVHLNTQDLDVGSFTPAHLGNDLAFQIGKSGVGYLLRESNLGHSYPGIGAPPAAELFRTQVCASGNPFAHAAAAWSPPNLYVPCQERIKRLVISSASPSFTIAAQGPNDSVTGSTVLAYGAVWNVVPIFDGNLNVVRGSLDAHDSQTLSLTVPAIQLQMGSGALLEPAHFAAPTPGYGHMYVATDGQISAYVLTLANSTRPIEVLGQPARLVDTRAGTAGPLQPGTPRCFTVAGQAGIPNNAAGAILNVTVTGQTGRGFLSMYPAGQPIPATSTLNFDVFEGAIANGAVVRMGTGGQVCVVTSQFPTHVILDAVGYAPPGGATGMPLLPGPVRVVDTRSNGGVIVPGVDRCFAIGGQAGVPTNAAGALLSVTAVGYAGNGWLTVYPAGQPLPATSTINFDSGEGAIANNALLELGTNGQVCAHAGQTASHLLVDVVGYLTTNGTTQLSLTQPQRIVDTRSGTAGPVPAGTSRCFTLAGEGGIPPNARAVVLNVTAVGSNSRGVLTLFPAGEVVPPTSSVNFDPRENAIANGAVVRLGTNGQVCINASQSASHAILDVTGFLV